MSDQPSTSEQQLQSYVVTTGAPAQVQVVDAPELRIARAVTQIADQLATTAAKIAEKGAGIASLAFGGVLILFALIAEVLAATGVWGDFAEAEFIWSLLVGAFLFLVGTLVLLYHNKRSWDFQDRAQAAALGVIETSTRIVQQAVPVEGPRPPEPP
jgi:fatty acid desaturase